MSTKTLPTISSYGTGQANSTLITWGDLDLYFSYKTIVAFRHPDTGLVVRRNEWGPTTAKHLNWIDGGARTDRVGACVFEDMLDRVSP